MIKYKQWWRLDLTINKLRSGHNDKTFGIHPKPMLELGDYCTHSAYDHNVGE